MSRPIMIGVSVFVLLASGLSAQEADPDIDVNGDGFYSFPELATAYPEVTADDFTRMDVNGDGLLDMAEVAAAMADGLWPETDQ